MDRGKQICKTLKELRLRIAQANNIPFSIDECPHEGPCPGTCPKCEDEVQYLKRTLAEKVRRGEEIRLHGLMSPDELEMAFSPTPEEDTDNRALGGLPTLPAGMPGPEHDVDILEGDAVLPTEGIGPWPGRYNCALALKLLTGLYDKDCNLVFSPMGVAAILEMLKIGTDEGSPMRLAIEELIGRYQVAEMMDNDCDNAVLDHASSLWYDQNRGKIKETYVKALLETFYTMPFAVDFNDAKATKRQIDTWVSRSTHGAIQELDLSITPASCMVLADAIYFKAKWEDAFDPKRTFLKTFHNANGLTPKVETMHRTIYDAQYQQTKDYQAITLPYEDYQLGLTIILPRKGKDLLKVMNRDEWIEIYSDEDYDVELALPKFRFDSNLDLTEMLKGYGLGDLMDRNDSLPKMSEQPMHVSMIKQQCMVAVEEEGTEAAAITYGSIEVGCLPPASRSRRHKMTVDRPFGFVISEGPHILFMGTVNNLGPAQ